MTTSNATDAPPASQGSKLKFWKIPVFFLGMAALAISLQFLPQTPEAHAFFKAQAENATMIDDAIFIAKGCGETVGPYTIRRHDLLLNSFYITVAIDGMIVLESSAGRDGSGDRRAIWREKGPWETSLAPVFAKQRQICEASIADRKAASREQALRFEREMVQTPTAQ